MASTNRKRYVPDTGMFLQCLPFDQLDWSLLTPATEIDLHVTSTVITELDKHKSDGNKRRAKRARNAIRSINKIIDDPANGILISSETLKLTVHLPSKLTDADREKIEQYTEPDRRIVEEVRMLVKLVGSIEIIAADAGMRLRARDFDLGCAAMPDKWLRPPEPSIDDKRISALETQLRSLQSDKPEISISVDSFDEGGRVEVGTVKGEALSESEIDHLVERISSAEAADLEKLRRLAMPKPKSSLSLQIDLVGHSTIFGHQSAEDRYKTRKRQYDEWREELRKYVREYASYAAMGLSMHPVSLVLANGGGASAEDVRVKLEAKGGVKFVTDEFVKQTWSCSIDEIDHLQLKIPIPLSIAKRAWRRPNKDPLQIIALQRMPVLPDILTTKDRYEFVREDQNEDDSSSFNSVIFTCDDFRHDGDEIALRFVVIALPDTRNGIIQCSVSARNMTTVSRKDVPVSIVNKKVNMRQNAEDMATFWAENLPQNDYE